MLELIAADTVGARRSLSTSLVRGRNTMALYGLSMGTAVPNSILYLASG